MSSPTDISNENTPGKNESENDKISNTQISQQEQNNSSITQSHSDLDLTLNHNISTNTNETTNNKNESSPACSKILMPTKLEPTIVTELAPDDSDDDNAIKPFTYTTPSNSTNIKINNYPEFRSIELNRFNSVDSLDRSNMTSDDNTQPPPSLPPLVSSVRQSSFKVESPPIPFDSESSNNPLSKEISVKGDSLPNQKPMLMRLSRNPNYMPHNLRQGKTAVETRSPNEESDTSSNENQIPTSSLPRLTVNVNPVPLQENAYTGLQNQGATCYMNSMLQALYHLPIFRSFIYKMDNSNAKSDDENIPLNLQRLFAMMQLRIRPSVPTKELTKSFGWTDRETYMQHDIQEFCRIILDNLEKKMNKQDDLKDAISYLFRGQMRNRIECVNVDYETTTNDYFYDLSMTVKDISSLEESFSKYIEPELINDYDTEEYGKQEIRKSIEFLQFPPVLYIHLRRFEYDSQRQDMIKINSRFEYPESIDLSQFMAADATDLDDQIFDLFGVLVHHGGTYSGHYYAFLRTMGDEDKWFDFNDSNVHEVSKDKAIESNYGGVDSSFTVLSSIERSYSAYMLIYIRRSKISEFYADVSDDEIPESAKEYVNEKKIEIEKKIEEKRRIANLLTFTILSDIDLQWNSLHNIINVSKNYENETIQIDKNEPVSELYQKAKPLADSNKILLYAYDRYDNDFTLVKIDSSIPVDDYRSRYIFLYTNFNRNSEVFEEEEEEGFDEYDEGAILIFSYVYFSKPHKHKIRFWESKLFSPDTEIHHIMRLFKKKFKTYPNDVYYYNNSSKEIIQLDPNRSLNDYHLLNGNNLIFEVNDSVYDYFEVKDQSLIKQIQDEEDDQDEPVYRYLEMKTLPINLFFKYNGYTKILKIFSYFKDDKIKYLEVPTNLTNLKFINFVASVFKIGKNQTIVFYKTKTNEPLQIFYDDQTLDLRYISKIDMHVLNPSIAAKQLTTLKRIVYFSGNGLIQYKRRYFAFMDEDSTVNDLIAHFTSIKRKTEEHEIVTIDNGVLERQDGSNFLSELNGMIRIEPVLEIDYDDEFIQLCITKRAAKLFGLFNDKFVESQFDVNTFYSIKDQEMFADTKRRIKGDFDLPDYDNIIYSLAYRSTSYTSNYHQLLDTDTISELLQENSRFSTKYNILIIDIEEETTQNYEPSFTHGSESRNESIVIRN